ncbi:MAG: polymerase, sigma-24 subunit, subfamily [Frankiales bacterium]|nr:polymerase, sigma-24 subunit, subfamily [Frankiales bacterium]
MGVDDLDEWLKRDYAKAYRTACLVLRNADDAEDAVQEAFLRVWRFRDAIPEGAGRTAWLYRVVVNACISSIRSSSSRSGRDDGADALEGLPDKSPEPAVRAEQSELAATIEAAMAELPDTLRIPLILRFYAGLSEKEIATAIDRRPGTVKSRLYDARQRLAQDPRLAAWVSTDDVLEASR